jgi:hypothetical protein
MKEGSTISDLILAEVGGDGGIALTSEVAAVV